MDDLYIDPNLEKLVTQRILFPADKFDDTLVPRPRFYVIHALPESRVLEALKMLMDPRTQYVTLEKDGPKDPFSGYLTCVVSNAHLLPLVWEMIPSDSIIVAINNTPPRLMHDFWAKFDYQLTYGVPPQEFIKARFQARFDAFGLKYNVRVLLKDADYEALALAADHCTEKDVDEWCTLVFRDVLFNKEKTITLEWLREQEFFISRTDDKISYITARPAMSQHAQYTVEPMNKKLRLH